MSGSNSTAIIRAMASTTAVTEESVPQQVLVLKLKKAPTITWTEDTVDNENLGRKNSKRCCIFHKVKKFDESDSDETDSGDDDGDDQEVDRKQHAQDRNNPVAAHLRHHA